MIMVKAVVYISIRQILLEDHRNHTQHFSNLMINKTLSLKCHIYEFIMSNRVFYNFGIHLHYVPFSKFLKDQRITFVTLCNFVQSHMELIILAISLLMLFVNKSNCQIAYKISKICIY